MTQKQAVEALSKALKKYGPAFVAVHLGYRDTPMILKWQKRGKIPDSKLDGVAYLLEDLT